MAAHHHHAFEIARAQFEIAVLVRLDQQNLLRGFELRQRLREVFGLVIRQLKRRNDLQLAIAQFRRKSRAQRAQLHLARQLVAVIARHRSVDRTAMPPDRAAHRTHAGAAGTLLLPQLLARTGHFVPGLDLVRAGARARQIMPHRLVEQVLIDFRAEHGVRQFHFADLRDYLNR